MASLKGGEGVSFLSGKEEKRKDATNFFLGFTTGLLKWVLWEREREREGERERERKREREREREREGE
jgi:hypothetical protein